MSAPVVQLYPVCTVCGWRKGGPVDSWNGRACKCGHSAAPERWAHCTECGELYPADDARRSVFHARTCSRHGPAPR